MDYGRNELAERLAAEYVVGTMRGRARRRFEALLPAHPMLRAAVERWQSRVTPLALAVTPVAPPATLWPRIEAQLWPAREPAPGPDRTDTPWWAQLAFWRGLSALASVAAVSLAVLLASPPPAQAPVVVVLSGTSGPAEGVQGFVASVTADGRALVTKPLVSVIIEADRALELWSVPAQGAPRSLGLISSRAATVVQRGKLLDGTSALAVSLEPAGGSPTGAPTGPILYVGKLTS
jgi:anti-sigma-K factor RskA